MRKRRLNANASRSVATMTRIIQDIYGSDSTRLPDPEAGREVAPEPAPGP
jgi:hypothetical protein